MMEYVTYAFEFPDQEEHFQLLSTLQDTLIRVYKVEFTRFARLSEKHANLLSRSKNKQTLIPKLESETIAINKIIAKQNQVFLAIIHILHLFVVDLKLPEFDLMLQQQKCSTLMRLLIKTLDRNDQALTVSVFGLLSELLKQFEYSQEIESLKEGLKQEHLALRMQRFFKHKVHLSPYYVLAIIFSFGILTDEEIKVITPAVLEKTDNQIVRQNTVQLLSLLSSHHLVKESIIENDYDLALFTMLLKIVEKKFKKGVIIFGRTPLQRSLINTVLNLTNDKKEADNLISTSLFKNFLELALKTLDFCLLKIVSNVTFFCDPGHTKRLEQTVIPIRDILLKVSQEENNPKVLAELVGILSNCCLGKKWEGFLGPELLKLLLNFLIHEDDNIRLQTILLFAQLAQHKKYAEIFIKKKVGLRMLKSINPEYREENFQKLFFVYQLLVQGVDISSFIAEVLTLIRDFMEQEYREMNVRAIALVNEIVALLEVRYGAEENEFGEIISSLMRDVYGLYNEKWEWAVKLDSFEFVDQEMIGGLQADYPGMEYYENMDYPPDYYSDDDDEYYMDNLDAGY